MRVKLVSAVIAMVVSAGSVFLASTARPQVKAGQLKFAFPYVTTDPRYKTTVEWTKEIEKQSKGRVKITVYPGGALCNPQDTNDSVAKGVADLALGTTSYTAGRFPVLESLEYAPGYFKSAKAAGLGGNALFTKYKPKEMADVHVFFIAGSASPRFMTKKLIRTLEDLKGMQIRSTGSRNALIKALGALPVGMPMGEAYDALQKGIVEGILTTTETLVSYRLNEVLNYMIDIPTTSTASFVIGNIDVWNSLPPDIQKIFNDATSEKYVLYACDVKDEEGRSAVEASVKAGRIQVITVSPQEEARWVKAMAPIAEGYIATLQARGLPGKEIMDGLYRWGKEYSAKYPE